MARVTHAKGQKAKADKLFSLIVRSRGKCERCGSTDPRTHQTAHIISRRFSNTRTDDRNAWCLCAGCHLRLTDHPDEHMAFVAKTIGMDTFYVLKEIALSTARKFDWDAEVARLRALAESLGIAA